MTRSWSFLVMLLWACQSPSSGKREQVEGEAVVSVRFSVDPSLKARIDENFELDRSKLLPFIDQQKLHQEKSACTPEIPEPEGLVKVIYSFAYAAMQTRDYARALGMVTAFDDLKIVDQPAAASYMKQVQKLEEGVEKLKEEYLSLGQVCVAPEILSGVIDLARPRAVKDARHLIFQEDCAQGYAAVEKMQGAKQASQAQLRCGELQRQATRD